MTRTKAEEEALAEKQYDKVPQSLKTFGLSNVYIWTHSKKFHDKPALNSIAVGKLGKEEWWDARTANAMQAFGLKAEEMVALQAVFAESDYANSGSIETQVWFESLGEKKGLVTEYQRWLLRVCEVTSEARVDFGEYLEVRRQRWRGAQGLPPFHNEKVTVDMYLPRDRLHVLHVREGGDHPVHLRHARRREALVHRRAPVRGRSSTRLATESSFTQTRLRHRLTRAGVARAS